MSMKTNEIDDIKVRIQAEIDKIYGAMGAVQIILPGKTPCGRCYEPAHITREVPSAFPGVKPMPVCVRCAAQAEELGVEVREIL
jgi:hypothetical protein